MLLAPGICGNGVRGAKSCIAGSLGWKLQFEMAASLVGCGCGEGFAAAAGGGTLCMQARSARPSPRFSGLTSWNSCRFPVRPSFEHSLFTKRSVDVRVAADYSDSKPESSQQQGQWGYHPLEDLSKVEKEEIEHAGDGKLTSAEVARTISEVNWTAFIFSNFVSDKDGVFATEVQYLIDEHGDLYFEIENDNEFLRNLSPTQIYTVLVGFGNVEGVQFAEEIEAEIEEIHAGSDSDDSSDENGDIDVQIYWEGLEESKDDSPEESFSSLGGWGGFESLEQVHPMDFASKVSELLSRLPIARCLLCFDNDWHQGSIRITETNRSSQSLESVSADYLSEIDQPTRHLTITGVPRPVTEEEESYVQGIWYDKFLLSGGDDGEDDESEDEKDSQLGDGKSVIQGKLKKTMEIAEGGTEEEFQRSGLSQNGVGTGQSMNGTEIVLNEEETDRNFASSELSSSEFSLRDFPSMSGSMAEDLDERRDGDRNGSDGHEGDIVSREIGNRKRRNKKRGKFLDSSDVSDEALEIEEVQEIVLPPGATLEGEAVVGEWTERRRRSLEIGTCFYKLEVVSIQLDTGPGRQNVIEVQEFACAEPDVLAHVSSAIMERVNSGGKKIESALKALCHRAKGLDVEEVSLIGVDCLGLDLRVRCGIEVRTLRISFSRRATCAQTADKLIDQLLFPRNGQRRSKKKGHY